jgi:hypothetical protein
MERYQKLKEGWKLLMLILNILELNKIHQLLEFGKKRVKIIKKNNILIGNSNFKIIKY